MRQRHILIMGLPKSGKTTLAKRLAGPLGARYISEDEVAEVFGVEKGSPLMASKIKTLSILSSSQVVIADFCALTKEEREIFDPYYIVWLDTVKGDLDRPDYDIRVTDDSGIWVEKILKDLC